MARPTSAPALRLRLSRALAACTALLVFSGACTGTMHTATGDVMSSYTTDHVVPYLLTWPDADYACQMGAAFGPFIASFERVTDRPDLAALMSLMGAGICSEARSWEAELTYLRALRAGRADEAADAQQLAERHHMSAAMRFGAAYDRAVSAFGAFDKTCPKLEESDELFFLLGIASGAQAVMHDRAASGAAGISMSIPPIVARASKCLDWKKWWGVPRALAAAVWMTVPGSAPAGEDPKKALLEAVAAGDKAGVRLARALQVTALAGSGDDEATRQAITAHATALKQKSNPSFRLLDAYGAAMTRHMSDRIWTKDKGHRAPTGDWGSFPEKAPVGGGEDDNMLEGL